MNARAKRGLTLIAASLAAIVVAGLVYLQPASSPTPPAISDTPSIPTLPAKYAVTYDFISSSTGWGLVSEQKSRVDQLTVYLTVDGARHWQKQFTTSMPFGQATLHFFDRSHGLISILSSPSELYRTADGGVRWTLVSLPQSVVTFAFADAMHGWLQAWLGAPGFGFRLFSTSDGGVSWIERNWPAAAVWGAKGRYGGEIEFRGNGEGWVGGYQTRSSVYLTHDDGVTWQPALIPVPSDAFPGVSINSRPAYRSFSTEVDLLPERGVLAFVTDYFGDVRTFVSFDYGQAWRMLAQPVAGLRYSDYLFQNATHWWAMRSRVLYKTSDAGLTWRAIRSPNLINTWTYQPHVIDAKHAWALMQRVAGSAVGTALALTSDGGITWKAANVPNPG